MRWFKGNTHAHTTESDGDSPPQVVIDWYRSHDYNFLVLSDHNIVLDPNRFEDSQDDEFILIPGEEVTDGAAGLPVHVNALGLKRVVPAQRGATVAEALQRDINAILAEGALPHINHPNFFYGVSLSDLQAAQGWTLLEIYNGHPQVNNDGDPKAGKPGVEWMWDQLLSSGRLVYGVASDDAHDLRALGPEYANPGRGWIMVRAQSLAQADILEALRTGDFYSSTGVELAELEITPNRIALEVVPEPANSYFIEFVGQDGHLLANFTAFAAEFAPQPEHGYVRVRVVASDGACCWTQPVFTR